MIRIHNRLQEGKYPNCSTLAKKIEVSTKTIQRDIDYMRDQLGLPIDYDGARHGYYYTEAVTSFPTIPATEGEMLALFVAQRALEQYRGTPFEKPLSHAFAKLAQVLEDEVTVDISELTTALSFHHTGAAVTQMEIFQKVTKALMDCRELEFSYRKLNGTRAEKRRVQPYHLASIDGQWYLFANDLARKDIRTFVLGRIQEIAGTGKKFKKPKDFSLTDRLMGSFGVFKGEGDYRVRIEFDPYAAQLVRERNWHSSQEIKDLPGGALELRLHLDSLEEVERWILSWGGHAKVLGPPQLKKRVQAVLKDMSDAYSESPRWFAELHEATQARQPERIMQLMMAIDRGIEHPGQMSLGLR
jgi:proteasome accessory factor B